MDGVVFDVVGVSACIVAIPELILDNAGLDEAVAENVCEDFGLSVPFMAVGWEKVLSTGCVGGFEVEGTYWLP